jgi:signal transduction histidine kinase
MNNLGEVYLKQGNRAKALEHYEVALKIEEKHNDIKMIALLHNNIGRVFLLDKNYKQAINHFENTLALLEKNKDRSIEAEVYYNLAQTFMAIGKSALAESYFHRTIESTMSLGENELLSKTYLSLSQFYYKNLDYKKAYDFLSEYSSLKDSIISEKAIENMAKMDAIYETVQNEETIKMLEKENRTKEENLYKEKIMQLIYLVTSVSLLFLSIALFALYRVKQKASKEMATVNRELHQLNATKDRFFSIISHDLKSPINSILGFTEMLNLHVETHSKAELLQYSQIINSSTKNLASLVDNLLLWSRTQVGATSYTPERIDVAIHCQNIISLLRFSAEEKDIILTGKLEKNLIAIADSNLFNTILRNLLSNAIKFSKVGGTIIIATKQVKNQIQISVADNGVGISPENLEKLFRIDTNVSTRGTFNEKGSGLGLILCKEFVEINKGNIWVESEQDKGSTFTFTVPLA